MINCVLLFVCKDLHNLIGEYEGAGYHGKKSLWQQEVWDTLHIRYCEESLTYKKYFIPGPSGESKSTPFLEPEPMPSSSSAASGFLDAPLAIEDKGCTNFPKTEAVEQAQVLAIEDVDEEDPTANQASPDELENAMERWVEMVESVEMLEAITWLSEVPENADNLHAMTTIFNHGMKYCTKFNDGVLLPWKMDDWPLNPRVWLAEMERTLGFMARRNMVPYWLRRPHDRNIRDDAGKSADGSTDPGNYILDMVVHSLRLWQYCEAGRIDRVMKQSIAEYGENANKSSHGPVNLRGNIVEAMQRNLQQTGTRLSWFEQEYDAYNYWVEWGNGFPSQGSTQQWATGPSASSSSSGDRRTGKSRWPPW